MRKSSPQRLLTSRKNRFTSIKFGIYGPVFRPFFCLLFFSAACTPPEHRQDWLVQIDRQTIRVQDFDDRFRIAQKDLGNIPVLDQSAVVDLKQRILFELISDMLLLQEVERRNIRISKDSLNAEAKKMRAKISEGDWHAYLLEHYVDERIWKQVLSQRMQIDRLLDIELNTNFPVSEAEVRSYYDETTAQISKQREIELSQIVVKDLNTAQFLLRELKQGKPFSELARQYSIGPEANIGGMLGYFGRNDLPHSFGAAFSLDTDQNTEVIETEYGFHIFRVSNIRHSFVTPYAQMRHNIHETLSQEHTKTVRRDLLSTLKTNATIEINSKAWNKILN